MKYQVFSDNAWLYPDSVIEKENAATLWAARGGDVCFQILTELTLTGDEEITAALNIPGCELVAYQLLTAHVGFNSGAKLLVADDYEQVKHFVTRKAPFDVFEITRPLDAGSPEAGRAAFYCRVNVAPDAPVGVFEDTLTLSIGAETLCVPVHIKIYNTQIPAPGDAAFHMVNWIAYYDLARDYGAPIQSERYWNILAAYIDNQLDMRNDHLMLPRGEAVRDEHGKIIDFDFSFAERVGKLALKKGFKYVMGGFSVQWRRWNEPFVSPVWDEETDACSIEGYRQLKLYFTRAWECVQKNGWQGHYMQCVMDEPQIACATNYRAICAICRMHMPGIRINDPIETPDLGGALDVWGVKQAIYEKYIGEFRALQEMGEEIWLYTCGFPAGYTMNRVIDLPLAASRLPMWMCYKYGAPGFLHYGYTEHNPEGRRETCFRANGGRTFPPGNSFVVYNGDDRPWYAVRGHLQRAAASDYELLHLLGERDKQRALALIERVCRTFDDYETAPALLDDTRRELLEALG